MPKVFTNGKFDILHAGHVQLLLFCRELAGKDGNVFVGIDDFITYMNPIYGAQRECFSSTERADNIRGLTINGKLDGPKIVDEIGTFRGNKELHGLIKFLNPDYIVKGDDWLTPHIIGGDIAKVISYPTYRKSLFSSSEIRKRAYGYG